MDLKLLLRFMPDLYVILDTDFCIVECSDAYEKLTKVNREDILSHYIFDVFPSHPADSAIDSMHTLKKSLEGVLKNKKPELLADLKYAIASASPDSGVFEERYWTISNTPVLSDTGDVLYILLRVQDVTDRKQSDAHLKQTLEKLKQANIELKKMAFFDQLTGIANHTQLTVLLNRLLKRACRYKENVTVFYIDIDHFKLVNDTYGHDAGDSLLKAIAERLHASIRANDIVARVGGDEFVIVLDQCHSVADAENFAKKLKQSMHEPILIHHHELRIQMSIGISFYPKDGTDVITLLKNADTAMYRAKKASRNNHQFYTPYIAEPH